MFVSTCCLLLLATTTVSAQPFANTYVASLELENIEWTYDCADLDLLGVQLGVAGCGAISIDIPILGTIGISFGEGIGDFYFNVDGNTYYFSESSGFTNDDSFQADDVISSVAVAFAGETVESSMWVDFTMAENDCDDADVFNDDGSPFFGSCPGFDVTDAISALTGIPLPGGLLVIPDPDDLYYYDATLIDWVAEAGTTVAGGLTSVNTGEFPLTLNYAGTDDDGDPFTATLTLTLRVVEMAACPNGNAVDVFPAGGSGYQCDISGAGVPYATEAATTSVTIEGGTPPYTIMGSGIYFAGPGSLADIGLGNSPQFPGQQVGDPFDFGVQPFGLQGTQEGDFDFLVLADQPWSVVVYDVNGCVASQEGVYDIPNPEISSDFSSVCLGDPAFLIFDEFLNEVPAAQYIAGEWFIDQLNPGDDGGLTDQGNGRAIFDPFTAGPGQHLISYCYENPYCPGGDQVCDDMVINVFPDIYPDLVLPVQTTTCTSEFDINLENFAAVAALLTSLEPTFDGGDPAVDVFINWYGPGVTDNADGSATFNPGDAGVGVHTICVEVGYPSCEHDVCQTIEVVQGWDADVALNPNFIVCHNVSGHAVLQGGQEVPSSGSSGTGDVYYTYDEESNVLQLDITYSGLDGTVTSAHVHNGEAGTNGGVVEPLNIATGDEYGTFSGSITLSAANEEAFIRGDLYVNIHTSAASTGEVRAQLNGFQGSLVCSLDQACEITLNDEAAAEDLGEFCGNGQFTSAPAGSGTATATITIPQEDQITQYAIIDDLYVLFNYVGTAGTSEGDQNGFTIRGPGNVTILQVSDPAANDPINDHFPAAAITSITFGANTFDVVTVGGQRYVKIDMDFILAAYDASTPAIAGDGEAAFINAAKCINPAFTYQLTSNSLAWQINLRACVEYTNRYGEFQATIAETGQVLPEEAITFDNETNAYWFHSRFVTAGGAYYDLGAYDEIEVCFLNVGNCETLNDPSNDAQCASQSCLTVQIVSGGNANINNTPLCLTDFDALHLPTAFFIDGVTTPGGIWTIADANSLDGASNTAGSGVYGEFFNPSMVPAGSYSVCYSLFEAEANPLIDCGQPIQGSDCVTIIVPEHYCVDFAEHVACEQCSTSSEDWVEIIVGTLDANGVCQPLEDNINLGGTVEETFTVCRNEIDNNNDGSTIDFQNLRNTTFDSYDDYDQADSDAATAICGDNPTTPEKREGVYTVLTNAVTLPAGTIIDSIKFRYNYISATGTAQGDHDGWGVYFSFTDQLPASCSQNVNGGTTFNPYPQGVEIDADGDAVGFPDGDDPDGDNHFPGGYPNTQFETRDASSSRIAGIQNAIDQLGGDECQITFYFYYIVASNSQYWDACFNVDVDYHFADGQQPQSALTAMFHEPSEDGNWIPVYPQWTPNNPIEVIDNNGDGVGDQYFLNTCNMGQFDEISVWLDLNQALSGSCDGEVIDACLPMAYSPALVVLDQDGWTCDFDVLGESPTACTGSTITIMPTGTGVGTFTFVNGVALPITDANPALDGIQYVIPAGEPTGQYTIIHTLTSPNGCVCTSEQTVFVTHSPTAVVTNNNEGLSVCTNSSTVLSQFFNGSTAGGSFTLTNAGGTNATILGGVLFAGDETGTISVTYSTAPISSVCAATATATIAIVTQGQVDLSLPSTICVGNSIDLDNYLAGTFTPGTFTVTGGTLGADNVWTAPATGGFVTVTFTTGSGSCAASDSDVIQVLTPEDAATDAYGYVCQSETDFTIDLGDFIAQNGNGTAVTGGGFSLGKLPPFVSEIEYDANSPSNEQEYVEVMAAQDADLSEYALYFYERTENTTTTAGVEVGKSSGRVYGVIRLKYSPGSVPTPANAPDATSDHHEDYDGAWTYNAATNAWTAVPGTDVDVISDNVTVAAGTGIRYGAVAFDPEFEIKSGAAGVALVNLRQAANRLNVSWAVLNANADSMAHFITRDLDYRNNDDVVQFLGYGTQGNTNAGIFSASNGPAATMTAIELGVVDAGGASRSIQFTNNCWQVPNITDAPLAYDDTPPYDTFQSNAAGQSGGTGGNAGVINYGLSAAGADEFYYNYIAPGATGQLHLDRLCWQLFAVRQNVGSVDNSPTATEYGSNVQYNAYTHGIEEGADDDQPGGLPNLDEDVVHFNCSNPVFTLPFAYQVPPTASTCGSDVATFYLTVLMDLEELWNAPESPICSGDDPFSLTDLIDDDVHYIQPYHIEGQFTASMDTVLKENAEPPYFSEIHYDYYEYNQDATDDHCIAYNYVDDHGTPANLNDDSYETQWICEGIEISAPVGTDLSCYKLAFFTDDNIDLGHIEGQGALGIDVMYLNANGQLVETDIVDNNFMTLYGIIGEDGQSDDYADGTIIYAPTWQYYDWNDADLDGDMNGYPYYGGVNPASGNQGGFYGLGNQPALSGLYLDANGNDLYDLGETQLAAGGLGTMTEFPWERESDCSGTAANDNVGSHWFPVVDMPNDVAGVGIWNACTGEIIDFISWGSELCVQDKEGFSMAFGPFEQLTSEVIDTVQNANQSLGDQRTLQLVHCNQLPGGILSQVQSSGCGCADVANDHTWVIVYNGGTAMIPTCGIDFGVPQSQAYSNTIGFYNCFADEQWFSDRSSVSLNLAGLLGDCDLSTLPGGVTATGTLPDNAVIDGHEVIVTIGTGDASDFQVYTYTVGAANCTGAWDTHDPTNHNANICNIGQLSDAYNPNEVCVDCADVSDNACIPGEFIDFAPYGTNAGGDSDVTPSGTYDGVPDFSPTDESTASGIQDTNDGVWETAFADGNGENTTLHNSDCYVGESTSTGKTSYTVSNLSAYIYSGNEFDPDPVGSTDTCRAIVHTVGEYTVTISVKIKWHQCVPTGNFHTNYDLANGVVGPDGEPAYAPMFTPAALNGGPITMNTDDCENPFWELDPSWWDDNNIAIQDVDVMYDVTNFNLIEADNVTDDLACLDDDADIDDERIQEITILSGAQAELNAATATVCSADLPLNLAQFVSSGAGVWSGAPGVASGFLNGAAGTYNLTYTAGAGSACVATDNITITVEQSASVNTSGIPTQACLGANGSFSVNLPAATWTGNGVTGNTFTANAAGSYTINYTAGSANCGDSGSVTIEVYAPISAVESNVDLDNCTATLSISGGCGSYLANGVATGSTLTVSLTDGQAYSVQISSPGCPCNALSFTGGPHNCIDPCDANAGSLAVNQAAVGCSNSPVQASASGNNTSAGYNTVYAYATSESATLVTSANGLFNIQTGGTYLVWAVNYADGVTPANTGAGIAAQIAAGDCIDVAGPSQVTINPPIHIDLAVSCETTPSGLEGYVIHAGISGGDNNGGNLVAYSINFDDFDGSLISQGGQEAQITIYNTGGTPFNLSDFGAAGIAVSACDGSNCCGSEVIFAPDFNCGMAANNDQALTLANQPIAINVLGNDEGQGLTVTNYTSPTNGTVTWDAATGTFIYTPNEGFTGEDVFTYEITNAWGQTTVAEVRVNVVGTGSLSASDFRDCSDAFATGMYVVTITVSGGEAPYVLSGNYNGVLTTAGQATFTVTDGSGYVIEVADAAGTVRVIDESDALPCTKVAVELLSFTGEVQDAGNLLKWVTASEVNNDYFTLEYSTNGRDYEVIATVDGQGNSSVAHTYNFLHTNAKEGLGYYRLSTVDFNGRVQEEKVITLVRGGNSLGFVSVSPVPATSVLNVTYTSTVASDVRVEVYNVAGQMVVRQSADATRGENTTSINVADLAAGTYYVSINNGVEVRVSKFVKQ